jgi:hypothetical protein
MPPLTILNQNFGRTPALATPKARVCLTTLLAGLTTALVRRVPAVADHPEEATRACR